MDETYSAQFTVRPNEGGKGEMKCGEKMGGLLRRKKVTERKRDMVRGMY